MTLINLGDYPEPRVVERLDFEEELAALISSVETLVPELASSITVEGSLIRKLLEAVAYHNVTKVYARANEYAKAVMLAKATGPDLDNLGALVAVQRLVITPAEPEALPPVAAVFEDDEALRNRIILALDGFTTAGSIGAYKFHAVSASGQVKDASVFSPAPGIVEVRVLSQEADGAASNDLLATVISALNDEKVRPLCDTVNVLSAVIKPYTVEAQVFIRDGIDTSTVLQAAREEVLAYVTEAHQLGWDVTLSGVTAALQRSGVHSSIITEPSASIVNDDTEAAFCTGINVTFAGNDV
jgi:phage-related baseplate assembly protein